MSLGHVDAQSKAEQQQQQQQERSASLTEVLK